jgi:hypothetical protein
MPLNQTYPGSVQGITVFIWANTGEIISYSNIAFGGVADGDTSDSEIASVTPSQSPIETDGASIDPGMTTVIAVMIVAFTATAIALILRKGQIDL